jgi:recombinational DNA repair ATPase RecF
MKVKKISLENFRGSSKKTVIKFDTSKSLSLIFGENGTGKSTIIDAFDFVCNKAFGSINNYSINKSANKYIATCGKKSSESAVELECDTGKWRASISGGSINTIPAGVPSANILRRSAILNLIEQPPNKRFEELRKFISVPFTEKTEKSLHDAISSTQKLFDEYSRALSQANDTLETLWTQGGKIGASSTEWAKEQVKIDAINSKTVVDAINFVFSLVSSIEATSNLLTTANIEELAALKTVEDINIKKEKLEKKQKGQDVELLSLLQEAQRYLVNNKNIDKCPVCGSIQNIEQLSRNVTSRIQDMKEAESLSIEMKTAHDTLNTKQTLKSQRKIDTVEQLKKLINYIDDSLPSELKETLQMDLKFINDVKASTDFSTAIFECFLTWDKNFQSTYKQILNNKKNEIQKIIDLWETIQDQLNVVTTKREQAELKQKTLVDLQDILAIIEKERKGYIENILVTISHDVSLLYSELHPDEKIGNPRFYLKANVKSSLEFDASFYEANEIPPQAYYSESHLDTLGICVFIALSKYYKSDSPILILDDVLTSIDAQHMERFMKMLYEQSQEFTQVIITTHYRPWKDRYKFARSAISNIDVIELGPWSLNAGIQISEFKGALDELKEISKPEKFDRQIAASKAGIVLESILDFITLKYRCSLPRTGRNEYTLGELVGGIDSKLSKLLKIKKGGTEIELKPILESVIAEQWIRNQVGCHFNLSGSDVVDSDIQKFVASVIKISELLICQKCMNLPRKNSGSFWVCSCKDNPLELHPLTQPGIDPRVEDDAF